VEADEEELNTTRDTEIEMRKSMEPELECKMHELDHSRLNVILLRNSNSLFLDSNSLAIGVGHNTQNTKMRLALRDNVAVAKVSTYRKTDNM
jgi:hypothetical protein